MIKVSWIFFKIFKCIFSFSRNGVKKKGQRGTWHKSTNASFLRGMSRQPSPSHEQDSSQKAMIAHQDNLTDALNSLGLTKGATNLSPEAKRHHENVALYMFIGLVSAFLFIATIIITVELYRSGRCAKSLKRKGDKGRTRLENEDDDDEGDYSEIEMNDL